METKETNQVLIEKKDGKAIITINRPQVLNAIDWTTFYMLQDAIEKMVADEEVRIIVLTGAGQRAFISGGDIAEELELGTFDAYKWSQTGHKFTATIENSPKPVIAAVNGYCLGGGFEFALACDFIICSENAKFGSPESKIGVTCGFGANLRLPRLVGKRKAKEMLMTGEMIDAQEAYRINLVNKVVPQAELMSAVDELCDKLLNKPAHILEFVKKLTDYDCEVDLRSGTFYENLAFGLIAESHDKREGMEAFLEKRSPEYKDC